MLRGFISDKSSNVAKMPCACTNTPLLLLLWPEHPHNSGSGLGLGGIYHHHGPYSSYFEAWSGTAGRSIDRSSEDTDTWRKENKML